jgi:hypothetical protein
MMMAAYNTTVITRCYNVEGRATTYSYNIRKMKKKKERKEKKKKMMGGVR